MEQTTLAVLEGLGSVHEPVTASEFAAELGCRRATAAEKLDELVERGDAECKTVGDGCRVWWPTEEGARERQLRRERDQTEQLLETSPVAISVRDADGDVVLANRRAEEVLGVSETDLRSGRAGSVDVTVYDARGEELSADELPSHRVRRTDDPVYDEELVVESADGDRRWVSVNAAPVFGPDGELERVITAGEEITELKERERELETELSEILGRVSDAFYALDEEFRFTLVNEQAERLLRRSEAELLGEKVWEAFPEAAEVEIWDRYHEAMETQEPDSFELYYDPLDFWVEANVYPSETGLSVYFRDVTDRVRRERELRESEQRYRTLAEHFPDGLVTLFDDDLRYTLAAGQAFDCLDVDPDDVEGRRPREAWNDERAAASIESALRTALDGSHESVEVSYADREWVLRAVPVTDEGGEVFAGMTTALDITERKEREQRLERFASVVSHGLRNPLSVAQIYLDLARESGDPDDFAHVGQALDRMETIIENLLTTTREGQSLTEAEAVDLAAVSERAWQSVETGAATLTVADGVGAVRAAEDQLRTALENLFRNAVEHGSTGRQTQSDDAAEHGSASSRPEGDDAVEHGAGGDSPEEDAIEVRVGPLEDGFYVEDTGPGIPPEHRNEVFEYGYTSGSGTGIGLAVVRDVVDVHGWDVTVTAGPEGGARFEIRGIRGPAAVSEPDREE